MITIARSILVVLLGGTLLGLSAGAVVAASPYDLFFQAESAALAAGGGDVPGQITGRPQVRRPTSLPETDRALIRLDYCSQTPLVLERGSTTTGRWDTDTLREQYILPVGRTDRQSGWTLGLQRQTTNDHIWYRLEEEDYGLRSRARQFTAALAYASEPGWRAGAGYNWGDVSASARGSSVAEMLDLPSGTSQWPHLESDGRQYTLGLSRRTGDWEWGAQYCSSQPHQTLYVTRATSHYTAPMQTTSQRREAYLARHRGSETYFVTGYDYDSHSTGTILLGITGRGDIELSTADWGVGIGRRVTRGARVEQLELDWRDSSFRTFNQGYAGIWPGLSADVYVLRADADVSTLSLRYGCQRPLSGRWSWLGSVGAHQARVECNWRLRSSQGIGAQPKTHSEHHIRGGRLYLLALSLGLSYENDRCAGTVSYTAGYAEVNSRLKRLFHRETGPGPEAGPGNKLKPNPVATVSVEYRF